MKVANQDCSFEEYADWMEEVIDLFEDLTAHPEKFFVISNDVAEGDEGILEYWIIIRD